MNQGWNLRLGALPEGVGVRFRIWAPGHETVEVVVYGPGAELIVPLEPEPAGFYTALVEGIGPGTRYRYRIDGDALYPDPLSRSQPDGVHGSSEVVDPGAYRWTDVKWRGLPVADLIVHEIHIGTFTSEGTFDAAIGRLDHLVALGVTALQLMPVAEFPGERNWGYDGVYLFAPSRAYGGPTALRRLVDAAHQRGIAVLLDVVYNHFGPEGNYLHAVSSGQIFNRAHQTPWGAAVNFDGPGCAAVRELIVENALHWVHEYRFDGLRLDATHAIIDDSPTHLLQELTDRVRASVEGQRHVLIIAEDERNQRRLLLPPEQGGYGLDAVWADDFHHQLRRLIAGDNEGYFANYGGTAHDLTTTIQRGWFYEGQIYPSDRAPRGTPVADLPPPRLVHTLQNHDQIGNRALGSRLNHDVSLPLYRAASALLLLSPYTPLLFMGQEWAASTPFLYFTDHSDELGELVTAGRREEFKHFSAFADVENRSLIPDPQSHETFKRSVLWWEEREFMPNAGVLTFYRELISLRRSHPALRDLSRSAFAVIQIAKRALVLRRTGMGGATLLLVCSFEDELEIRLSENEALTLPPGARWEPRLWSELQRFGGDGAVPTVDRDGVVSLTSAGALVLEAQVELHPL